MLFFAGSLSSLWKYFFLVRIHCSVYVINSLLAATCLCSRVSYLLDCKPRLMKFFHDFMQLTTKGGLHFYFVTLSKGIDDAVFPWLRFVDPIIFFRILFSSASRAHPSQEGL